MAEKKITNKELAELSGIHPTSISKLKNADEIEQISGRVLNNLCNGLTIAYHAKGDERIITPGDLFEYTFDGGSPESIDILSSTVNISKSSQLPGTDKSSKPNAQVVWLISEKEVS